MKSDLILTNANIVLDDEVIRGTVVVRDGHIAEISDSLSISLVAKDMNGDYLTPGLIELHTDNVERHLVPRPGVRWPAMTAVIAHDAAIAAAGITTVLDAIACGSDHGKEYRRDICDATVRAVTAAQARGHLRVDHLLHLRCEIVAPDMPEQFERNIDSPLVALVSIMDHTPGARQFVDMGKFREYYMGKHALTAPQLDDMIVERRAMQARYAPAHRQLVVERCRAMGMTLASHDDATPGHVDEALALGVSICEFPTTVEAAKAARRLGLKTIMGAPNMVRGGSHSGNVAARTLAEQGLLDAFSSDYVPSSLMEAAWLLHETLPFSIPEAFRTVSSNPAGMLGLSDRGSIEIGRRGDLVRVTRTVDGPVIKQVWRLGARVA